MKEREREAELFLRLKDCKLRFARQACEKECIALKCGSSKYLCVYVWQCVCVSVYTAIMPCEQI